MKIFFLISLGFLNLTITYSQTQITFQKSYGDIGSYEGYAIQQTNDGGYVIAGGGSDLCLIKTDLNGDTLWTKTFSVSTNVPDHGYSVRQTIDGGFIIAGQTFSSAAGIYQIYLVKTDSAGNLNWSKSVGGINGQGAYCIQQTKDGGYIITGYTLKFSTGFPLIYLVKTNSGGNIEWTKTFEGTGGDIGKCVIQTTDGGYVIVGQSIDNIFMIKTDSTGNINWTKTYGGTYGVSVQQTMDRGFILAGSNHQPGSLFFNDMLVIKTDSTGNLLWSKTYGGSLQDGANCIQLTKDGGFIIAGSSNSFGNVNINSAYVVKADSNGNVLWSKIYGEIDNHSAYSVQQTTDRGYIISGSTNPVGPTNKDIYLIKTDSTGKSGCNEQSATTMIKTPVVLITIPTWIDSSGGISAPATTIAGNIGTMTDLCKTVGTNELIFHINLHISPNPFSNQTTVQTNIPLKRGKLTVYNCLGQLVAQLNNIIGTTFVFSRVNLPSGLYFIKLSEDDKTIAAEKIIIGD
jgi:hypothetical protein